MTNQVYEKSIVFNIPFNNLNPLNKQRLALTEGWIRNRLRLFMKYTLNSLKSQTNQRFLAFVLYDRRSEVFIKKHLAPYGELPRNVKFIPADEYAQKVSYYIQGSQYFYEIELGSDDLYHKEFVQKMYAYRPKADTVILICQDGYIYSSVTGELAEYFNYSSFFNCWIYKTEEYLKGLRLQYYGFVGAIDLVHEKIPWRAYINHSHHTNVAFSYELEKETPWGKSKAYVGRPIVDEEEKKALLESFGIINDK